MSDWAAVILAAGKGARMKSKLPKALHPLCGRPMVRHVERAVREAGIERVVVVVGVGAGRLRAALGPGVETVEQPEPLGTGHAAAQAAGVLAGGSDDILVINGDTPLVTPQTLTALMAAHADGSAPLTFLTACVVDPASLGRVARNGDGAVRAIVEEADLPASASVDGEVNAGVYCFDAAWLWARVGDIAPGAGGERYITSLAAVASDEASPPATVECGDPTEAIGVDTRLRLAEAEAVMRARIREHWMAEGVTLADPATIYIDADAVIGRDTVIHANTSVRGASRIGEDCEIGPGSIVSGSHIGDGCAVVASVIEQRSRLEAGVRVGPYSHVRGGSEIGRGVHLGNFVEVNRSVLGPGTRSHHFSYIGDGLFGADVNVGAGTITCNFDGVDKHPTVVEDGAQLGSDSMLVAPVHVGAKAKTGAGTVVTTDLPPESLTVGVPGRVVRADARSESKVKESKATGIARRRKARHAGDEKGVMSSGQC